MVALGALGFAAVLIVLGGGLAGGAHNKDHYPAYTKFPAWLLSVPAIIWTVLLAGVLTGYGAAFLVALGWAIIWFGYAISWLDNAMVPRNGSTQYTAYFWRMVVSGVSLQVIAIFISFLALFPWGTMKKMGAAYGIGLLGWITAFIGSILFWDVDSKNLKGAANQPFTFDNFPVNPSVMLFIAYTASFFALYTVSPHAHGAAAVLLGFVTLYACNYAFFTPWPATGPMASWERELMAGWIMIAAGAFIESIAVILLVNRTMVAADEVGHDHPVQAHNPEGVPLQNTAGQGVAGV